jgi:hypothetical protein
MNQATNNKLLGLVAKLKVLRMPVTRRTGGVETRAGMLNRSVLCGVKKRINQRSWYYG